MLITLIQVLMLALFMWVFIRVLFAPSPARIQPVPRKRTAARKRRVVVVIDSARESFDYSTPAEYA